RLGSSARLFSSARRASAASQSKMPPQQCNGLLDLFVKRVGFGGHGATSGSVEGERRRSIQPAHAVVDSAMLGAGLAGGNVVRGNTGQAAGRPRCARNLVRL